MQSFAANVHLHPAWSKQQILSPSLQPSNGSVRANEMNNNSSLPCSLITGINHSAGSSSLITLHSAERQAAGMKESFHLIIEPVENESQMELHQTLAQYLQN